MHGKRCEIHEKYASPFFIYQGCDWKKAEMQENLKYAC
jgi:hypothetical protein